MTSYIFDDNQLVDVGELSVNKLPQRLLLVSLHLRHGLTIKKMTEEEERGKEEGKETTIRDAKCIVERAAGGALSI